MDFISCLLCDILNGMPTPGGILIDNDSWFAVHAPPRACRKHLILIGSKRHIFDTRRLTRVELTLLTGLQRNVDRALHTHTGLVSRVTSSSDRFGHLAWLVWPEDDDGRPVIEQLASMPDDTVLEWTRELELPFDDARIAALGGRLPLPPLVPGDAERSTLRAPGIRFCRHCGARLVRVDYTDNRCHGCGKPIV
ncbi:MAG: hypothetical protein AAB974_02330 [Patescibacteria group bacterium]